jgi:hypothetical protein
MLLPVQRDHEGLQPLPQPRIAVDRQDRDLKVTGCLLLKRPQGRARCVGVSVRHL